MVHYNHLWPVTEDSYVNEIRQVTERFNFHKPKIAKHHNRFLKNVPVHMPKCTDRLYFVILNQGICD